MLRTPLLLTLSKEVPQVFPNYLWGFTSSFWSLGRFWVRLNMLWGRETCACMLRELQKWRNVHSSWKSSNFDSFVKGECFAPYRTWGTSFERVRRRGVRSTLLFHWFFEICAFFTKFLVYSSLIAYFCTWWVIEYNGNTHNGVWARIYWLCVNL